MPRTGKLSPTAYSKYHGDWSFPERALSSDDSRASENKPADLNDWYGFDMSEIPENAVIDAIRIYAEGYVADPQTQFVLMGYKKDGSQVTAWSFETGFTDVESLHLIVEPQPNEPKSAWVNLLVDFLYTELGGCVSPESEIEMWDGRSVRADQIRVGDLLLSFDFPNRRFCKAKVEKIIFHTGDYLMYKFFTVKPDLRTVSDVCVTETHPLWVHNRNEAVPAKEIAQNDELIDLWHLEGYGKVLRPVKIQRIEQRVSEKVIEIVCTPKTFFSGEKLGKSKT